MKREAGKNTQWVHTKLTGTTRPRLPSVTGNLETRHLRGSLLLVAKDGVSLVVAGQHQALLPTLRLL